MNIQDTILTKFLFNDFLHTFKKFFIISKRGHLVTANREYYTMEGQEYHDFMTNLLKNLEPV